MLDPRSLESDNVEVNMPETGGDVGDAFTIADGSFVQFNVDAGELQSPPSTIGEDFVESDEAGLALAAHCYIVESQETSIFPTVRNRLFVASLWCIAA